MSKHTENDDNKFEKLKKKIKVLENKLPNLGLGEQLENNPQDNEKLTQEQIEDRIKKQVKQNKEAIIETAKEFRNVVVELADELGADFNNLKSMGFTSDVFQDEQIVVGKDPKYMSGCIQKMRTISQKLKEGYIGKDKEIDKIIGKINNVINNITSMVDVIADRYEEELDLEEPSAQKTDQKEPAVVPEADPIDLEEPAVVPKTDPVALNEESKMSQPYNNDFDPLEPSISETDQINIPNHNVEDNQKKKQELSKVTMPKDLSQGNKPDSVDIDQVIQKVIKDAITESNLTAQDIKNKHKRTKLVHKIVSSLSEKLPENQKILQDKLIVLKPKLNKELTEQARNIKGVSSWSKFLYKLEKKLGKIVKLELVSSKTKAKIEEKISNSITDKLVNKTKQHIDNSSPSNFVKKLNRERDLKKKNPQARTGGRNI